MTIFNRNGVLWYVFEVNGRRYKGSCGTKSDALARRIESKVRMDAVANKFGVGKPKEVPSLKEFGKIFTKELELRFKSKPDTLDFYQTNFTKIINFTRIGRKDLCDINEQDIHALTAHCASKEGLADSTINRRLATLRKALRFAKRLKIIETVPHFEMFKEPAPRDFVLTPEFEEYYLSLCPKHLFDYSVLGVESGMRMMENIRLMWPDVYFKPAGIGTRPYIHCRGTKSKNSDRFIPMSTRLTVHLQAMYEVREGDYVLSKVTDKTAMASKDTLEDAHQRLRTKHKLPEEFVLHSLRHTMLTRLGEAGAGAFEIMKLAGHSSITMSQRYVHPTAGALDRAIDMMDNFHKATPKTRRKPAQKHGQNTKVTPKSTPRVESQKVSGLTH